MIPTTAKERRKCYRKAIKLLRAVPEGNDDINKVSVCTLLMDNICGMTASPVRYHTFAEEYFPEFWSLRPEFAPEGSWYPPNEIEKRIKLLKKAIRLARSNINGYDVAALLHGIHHHDNKKGHAILYYEEDLLPILKALGLPSPIWKDSTSLKEWLKTRK